MKRKISLLSKKILFTGLSVCAAFYLTYILWTVISFGGTIYSVSKLRLAVEAGKLMLTCIAELIFGSYIIDRVSQAD